MKLPEKKDPRTKTLSIKIRESIFKDLKMISKKTGLSQPDIIEHLIEAATKELESTTDNKKKK